MNLKKIFHYKYTYIISACLIFIFCYGGYAIHNANYSKESQPIAMVSAKRATMQRALNVLGKKDISRAKVSYNHNTHELHFLVENYDNMPAFQKGEASQQTSQFQHMAHIHNITYSLKLSKLAIQKHNTQVKEQQEQKKQEEINAKKAKIAQQKAIQQQKKQVQQQKKQLNEQRKKQQKSRKLSQKNHKKNRKSHRK